MDLPIYRWMHTQIKCDTTSHLMSIKEYACMWSWLRWMSGSKSTRNDSKPNSSNVDKNFCLILSQQNGLHLTTSRELGTAHKILAQTCNTFGVICQRKTQWIKWFGENKLKISSVNVTFARLLKLPNVMKPFEIAGVGQTGPASGEGV